MLLRQEQFGGLTDCETSRRLGGPALPSQNSLPPWIGQKKVPNLRSGLLVMLDPARTSLSQPHAGKKSRQEFIGAIPVHPPGFGAVCYNRMTQIPFGPDRSSPDILKSLFNTRHRAHAGTFRTCRGVQARPEPRQTMSPARGKPGVWFKSAQQIGRLPFPPFTSQDLLCACQAKQRDDRRNDRRTPFCSRAAMEPPRNDRKKPSERRGTPAEVGPFELARVEPAW